MLNVNCSEDEVGQILGCKGGGKMCVVVGSAVARLQLRPHRH